MSVFENVYNSRFFKYLSIFVFLYLFNNLFNNLQAFYVLIKQDNLRIKFSLRFCNMANFNMKKMS